MTSPFPGNSNWPADWQGCRIHGKFITTNGVLRVGKVTLTPSPQALVDLAFQMVIGGEAREIPLVNGELDIMVPATDDVDVQPYGWTYHVVENWTGGRTYDIEAPQGTTVELAEAAGVPASLGVTIMRGPAGPTAADELFTTAQRQALTGVAGGRRVFDTSLLKPVWFYNGVWRDAMGTAV